MTKIKIKLTVSHNEVKEGYSVMSTPSTIVAELSEERTRKYNEIKDSFPSILYVWGQYLWDITYPNTFGKVIKVDVI